MVTVQGMGVVSGTVESTVAESDEEAEAEIAKDGSLYPFQGRVKESDAEHS